MTFALLIYKGAPPPTTPSPTGEAGEEESLARHRLMQAEAEHASELLAVAHLGLPDRTSPPITDGPYIEAKEWLVGFYLLDCPDEAAAVARGRQIAAPQYRIEVRPCRWHHVP